MHPPHFNQPTASLDKGQSMYYVIQDGGEGGGLSGLLQYGAVHILRNTILGS